MGAFLIGPHLFVLSTFVGLAMMVFMDAKSALQPMFAELKSAAAA